MKIYTAFFSLMALVGMNANSDSLVYQDSVPLSVQLGNSDYVEYEKKDLFIKKGLQDQLFESQQLGACVAENCQSACSSYGICIPGYEFGPAPGGTGDTHYHCYNVIDWYIQIFAWVPC